MTEKKSNSAFDLSQFKPLYLDRKNIVFHVRLAETAERYDDMCKIMRTLVEWTAARKPPVDLTVDARNLLSVAYKNVVGARRASWRTLNADEHKDEELVKIYKKQIESELDVICKDVLELLQKILLVVNTEENESRVFYLKLTADYYRYLAEFAVNNQNATEGYDKKAAEFYQQAMDIAAKKLSATHPIRLGLALNYSVCLYEILKDTKKACELAKTAFDNAISKLDKIDEASYKDATLIMQLIRDNLTLWTSSDEVQGGEAD